MYIFRVAWVLFIEMKTTMTSQHFWFLKKLYIEPPIFCKNKYVLGLHFQLLTRQLLNNYWTVTQQLPDSYWSWAHYVTISKELTELSIQSLTKQTLYVYVVPEYRIVHIDTLLKRLAPSRCLEATWDIRKLLQLKSCGTI